MRPYLPGDHLSAPQGNGTRKYLHHSKMTYSVGLYREEPAFTASLGRVPEICATKSTSATGAAVRLIPGATASLFPNTKSKRVIGTKTTTKGTSSPVPPVDTSKERMAPLPTPFKKESDIKLVSAVDIKFDSCYCI